MWFKNAHVFRLTKAKVFSQINLALLLSEHKFRECGSTEPTTFGWESALPGKENLVHSVDNSNYQLIRSCKSVKTLPADFIRREMDKKVLAVEQDQCRKATKKEKEQFKEDIVFEHLPNAFPVHTFTSVYLDNVNELVIIDSASRAVAEDVLALLRKSIGTLPVTSYFTDILQECLDGWVSGQRPLEEKFTFGRNVQLSGWGDSPAQAKFTNDDVTSSHITTLIKDEDREVNYLSLEFDEVFSFTLDAKGFLKGIKPYDVLKEQNDDVDSDDPFARIDADFVLFANEMSRLFSAFKELKVIDETEKDVFDATSVNEKITGLKAELNKLTENLSIKVAEACSE